MVRNLRSWFGVPLAVAAVAALSLGSGPAEAGRNAGHTGQRAAPRDVVEAWNTSTPALRRIARNARSSSGAEAMLAP